MPIKLGVVFGSRSVEHEVSIITACQLMAAADPARYTVVPLYIDKLGRWWTGDVLQDIATYKELDLTDPQKKLDTKIKSIIFSPDPTQDHGVDVVLSCLHGGMGEDGTISGLMALANLPFAAPNVVAAAAAIDKVLTKHIAAGAKIPVTPYIWFTREQWQTDPSDILSKAEKLEFPVFVKPATLGSSIGVTKVSKPGKALQDAVDLAASFDGRLIIEQGAHDCIEVNISVTRTSAGTQTSLTEQPITNTEFLTYAEKYEKGGGQKSAKGMASLSRRIPAPIAASLVTKIENTARQIWDLIGASGVARIDFFADPSSEQFYLGEVNAPPGSMAYYLWEPTGLTYPQLIDRLVEEAQTRHAATQQLMDSVPSNILSKQSSSRLGFKA